jgi:hypothetical protein
MRACFAMLLASLATACGGGGADLTSTAAKDTGTAPVTQPAVQSRAGQWAGTTSEGFAITFTATDSSVGNLSFSIKLTGDCGISVFKPTILGTVGRMSDNQWFMADSTSVVYGGGTFNSDTDMSGTLNSNYVGTFADGRMCHSTGSATFTAKKQ